MYRILPPEHISELHSYWDVLNLKIHFCYSKHLWLTCDHSRSIVKWSPCYVSLIRQIESVQNTKRPKKFSMLHYCERINKLGAEILEMKRLKLDLVMFYDILYGFVDIYAGSLFDTINGNVIRSGGHWLRIIKQQCNVNRRSSSFVCRNINAWNSLPEHVVNCATVIV